MRLEMTLILFATPLAACLLFAVFGLLIDWLDRRRAAQRRWDADIAKAREEMATLLKSLHNADH